MQSYVLGAYVSIVATMAGFAAGTVRQSGRYAAFTFDPNDLGLTLALGIPMAWQLMHRQAGRLGRWVNGVYLPAAIVSVLLTASRGALVATVIATSIVVWSFARLGRRAKVTTVLLISVTAAGVHAVTPASSWQRLAKGREELATGDISYRLVIWRAGAREFLARPTAGVGAGAFRVAVEPALGRAWAAHNTYLAILVEQGLIGFAIFATMGALLLWRARAMPPWERRLCLVLSFTWAAGVGTLTWEHRKPTWFVLGLLISHAGVAWSAGALQTGTMQVRRREVADA
jgi:O-antigen ligase